MPRGSLQTPLNPAPGGVREELDPVLIPVGWLLDSSNWLTRRGVGRPRPGYDQNFQVTDAKRVLGIALRGSRDQTDDIVVHTTDHAYSWNGTTVTDITGSGWTISTDAQLVRMVTFPQGGTDYLLMLNHANTLREWTGTGTTTATTGSPPNGKDLCVAGNRVVIVHPSGFPSRVRWSDFKDRTVWSSTNATDLSDTTGSLVACRAFGPNTFGVYKDDAIYLGAVQAAVEPFQFQFIARVPGPISPAALTDALGIHYWMAEDYGIYQFDGSAPKLISGGLSKTIGSAMSYSDREQTFSFPFFSQDEREVWFFYPTQSGTFNTVSFNVVSGAVNHHTLSHVMTAAAEWRMQSARSIDDLDALSATIDGLDAVSTTIDGLDGQGGAIRNILLGDTSGNVYTFGPPTSDDGAAISWSFTHPWVAPGELETRIYLDGLSSLWKLTAEAHTVTVDLTVSDRVTDNETATTTTFETSTDSQHLIHFANKSGKFVKVKHSGSGYTTDLEYRGSLLSTWPKGRL